MATEIPKLMISLSLLMEALPASFSKLWLEPPCPAPPGTPLGSQTCPQHLVLRLIGHLRVRTFLRTSPWILLFPALTLASARRRDPGTQCPWLVKKAPGLEACVRYCFLGDLDKLHTLRDSHDSLLARGGWRYHHFPSRLDFLRQTSESPMRLTALQEYSSASLNQVGCILQLLATSR